MTISTSRLDDAARAAWLYYVAGNTQDEIASKLGVSRQSAQRLVSLASTEGLVKVRIDHPIAHCLTLAQELRQRGGLEFVEIVPTDPASDSTTLGIAQAAGAEIERWLRRSEPTVIGIGTGRTLKAAIEQLPSIESPQHKVVSLTGSIAPDGSAAFYNVVFTMADTVKSRAFPLPLPVIASSRRERDMLQSQPMIRSTLELGSQADVAFLGVGDFEDDAPLYMDGFISQAELKELQAAGAVGEIIGWAFDARGQLLEGMTNDRVASSPLPDLGRCRVIATAMGKRKLPAIRAAIRGKLINGLVTDEATAQALIETL